MADKKISQLTAATTPVAGTETLPIVQGGSTKQVSIDNLTKGRVVNALTFDTDVAAAGVTLTGTTLAADGTNTDININLTPKGTGSVVAASAVEASGAGGFKSSTFVTNARNPIWRFGNSDTYGISYFQGTAGYNSVDTIGLHFGTATADGSPFKFTSNGQFTIKGFNTDATIYNDANGFVFKQNGEDKVRFRGIGGGGGSFQMVIDDTNAAGQPGYSFISDTDTGMWNNLSTPNVVFFAAGGLQANTLNANGIGLGSSTLPASNGVGIRFPASASASSDPNTLDDYEEGTWNVVWTNLTGTPTSTTGYYTKIGRVVNFTYATGAGAISGTAGNVRFTLPFVPAQKSAGQSIAEGPGNANVNWIHTDGLCYPIGFSAAFMIFSGTYIV